ncbi:esterase-like activity of phytase family protein [uncultured Roseobacter sp.]|uniref:esterase-like activity of phytase family protein n=1 Tax=uncultured Roseobacter sp. TaxID=114847 RepID=UPI0026143426|nr:esterase-like activity of phytase family protein [uncultured Roseobacter sp.]
MRRRLAIGSVALLLLFFGAKTLLSYYPIPPQPRVPAARQPAQHLSTYIWRLDEDWFGGLSALELSADGTGFFAVGDRGRMIEGQLERSGNGITGARVTRQKQLVDADGAVMIWPFTDAEGLAITEDGGLFISFERQIRVLYYPDFNALPQEPGYTRAWRAIHIKQGLEALAIAPDGTLYTLPETAPFGASVSLVYRRSPGGDWTQPFTLPLDDVFVPVGADFGPDGRLYLLERDFRWFGFRTRIRAMTVTPRGVEQIETLLETPLFQYGNLEGLSVWRDDDGRIRLTMIGDDNFLPVLKTEIVEYILQE